MLSIIARHLWWHVQCGLLNLLPDPVLRRNKQLRNRHAGQRCFIIGSGPSIKQQDLTRLAGEKVITQNHFHAHPQIAKINPAYHVVVPKYQPREFDQDWVAWLTSMNERLPKSTAIFFGKNTKYLVDQLALFANRAFYLRTGCNCALVRRAPTDLTRSLMQVPTVLPLCIATAIYMGFREIYLLGFDLDQPFLEANRESIRFYATSPVIANAAEKALDDQAGSSGLGWLNYWIIWRECNLLRAAAERRGIRIVNLTRGGLLNMFERQRYEDVVS